MSDFTNKKIKLKRDEEIPTHAPSIYEIEPKRNNRFYVTYPDILGIGKELTHTASRPTYNFSEGLWEDMTFIIYDPIYPSTTMLMMDGVKLLSEQIDRTILINLFITDPSGNTVEQWNIEGEILKVDFGSLDYSKDTFLNVEMLFKVKNALVSTPIEL